MTSKRNVQFILAAGLTILVAAPIARAQRHEEHERGPAPKDERHYAPRPEPPKYAPHPAGAHPHGAIVRPHAVRVLAPKSVRWGAHPWHHWEHPEFARPVYYWNWGEVRGVTCTAEDSYGDQYPVSINAFNGFGLGNMSSVEDDALDRCYSESQGDQSCYVATCTHY